MATKKTKPTRAPEARMINLRLRTEYHISPFRSVFAPMQRVIDVAGGAEDGEYLGIGDCTAFGHVAWVEAVEKVGRKAVIGLEVPVYGTEEPAGEGEISYGMTLVARDSEGLKSLYRVASLPRIAPSDVCSMGRNVLKLLGRAATCPAIVDALRRRRKPRGAGEWDDVYADLAPDGRALNRVKLGTGFPTLPVSDNWYPRPEDRATFALFGGSVRASPSEPQHILLRASEFRAVVPEIGEGAEPFLVARRLAEECASAKIERVENIRIEGRSLMKECRAGIRKRRELTKERWAAGAYEARLRREVEMIETKGMESYFFVLADMVRYAKKHMLVGPARGSAAGSLVCYLLGITDVDPIPHGLLFERFIDITRKDFPDIDMDFQDEKREIVLDYLGQQYGAENVARIGTVLTYQPKSILGKFGKQLSVPFAEMQKLKDSMIERSSGDARAALCLLDTLETLDAGKEMLKKYPALRRAADIEGHAVHLGKHAAGMIVAQKPVHNYTVVRDGVTQIDKINAERIGFLKIDALGLRTLSILAEAIEGTDISLPDLPLNDEGAFRVLNDRRYAGIFQFEGSAVQALASKITINAFTDISALGALARPGPMMSGGAEAWCRRKNGAEPVEYFHAMTREDTEETFGIILYQEQVMTIGLKVGGLGWDDVTALRKAMSKSLGKEFFDRYWEKFREGALNNGLKESQARLIWDNMNTMGSWAFNKSHSVSYGLISYWCAYLKAHRPLPFFAASLRHANSEERTLHLLREMKREGVPWVAFDPDVSGENWSVVEPHEAFYDERTIVGGWLNVKGIGPSKAQALIARRDSKEGFTAADREMLKKAEILYRDVTPAETAFGEWYRDPSASGYRIRKWWRIGEVVQHQPVGFIAFIGRLTRKDLRDLNEYGLQIRRKSRGKPELMQGQTQFLMLVLADDTGEVLCSIGAREFDELGKGVVNEGVVDETWYAVQARRSDSGFINITWILDVTDMTKPKEQEEA